MANPTWFNYNFYMAAKLTQMQKTNPSYSPEQLKEAFKINGFDGEEGAYNHYNQYGDSEGLSPSMYVDHDVYMTAKLLQMKETDPKYTMDQLEKAFADTGLTAGEHYALYGKKEGLNPSNAFDADKYMADKLDQLIREDSKGEWTAAKVEKAFADAGLSPLDHFLLYGKIEGLTAKAVDTPIHPYNPGTELTLTNKVESFVGTDKNDTVTGKFADLAGDTLLDTSSADFDVINLTADAAVVVPGKTAVAGFEILNVDWQGFGNASIDAAGFTGVKEINASSAKVGFLGNLAVAHAGAAAVAAGAGMKGTLTVSDLNGGTVKTGVATSATVTLEDKEAASGTVKVSDATKEVTFNGSASTGETGTVVFSAIGTLKTNETIETLTIDAGGKTITLDASAAAVASTIKTAGTGDMTLKMGGADFGANFDTVTKGNTGILTVDIATNAATMNTTKVSADIIKLSAAGATVVTTKSGQNFEVTADLGAGGFTVATSEAVDTVNVTYKASQATSTTFTDVENAIITAAAKDLTFTSLDGGANTVTMKGTGNVTLTKVAAKVLNAAALVGDLTATTASGATSVAVHGATGKNTVTFNADTINANFVGQDASDAVTFGTVAATSVNSAITGGGDDTVKATLSSLATGTLSINTGAGDDTVSLIATTSTVGKAIVLDFGAGIDTLKLDNTATNADFTKATNLTIKDLDNIELGTHGAAFNAAQLSGQTLNIKGTAANSSVLSLAGTAAIDTIDLSHMTVSTGRADGAFVKVDGGTGKDNILLGTGDFTVKLTAVGAIGNIDTITGFDKNDALSFNATPTEAAEVVDATFDTLTLDDVLETFIASTGTHTLAINTAAVFTHKGETYVLINDGTAGYANTDAVVHLAGVTASQVVAMGDIFVA